MRFTHTKRYGARLIVMLVLFMGGGVPLSPGAQGLGDVPFLFSLSAAAAEPNQLFLPLLVSDRYVPRVNAPYLPVATIFPDRYDEMAVFWLGRVGPTENYADVRIGYSDTALELVLGIVDRLLWFDSSPSPSDLEAWDAVTVFLNLDQSTGNVPDANTYRLVSQLSWVTTNRDSWQIGYRGNGASWAVADVPFRTANPWRGDAPNNTIEDRGWEARFRLPFSSLGLSGPPAPGTVWKLGVSIHDRDDSGGTPIGAQHWPAFLNSSRIDTWGQLHFGHPEYAAPPATVTSTVLIREGLAGVDVPDAAVGGTLENLCPGNSYHLWNEWGNSNYGNSRGQNIQNQRDIADWPCFAKYFVKFPLSSIPRGRNIISATLTLSHWGNSGVPTPGQWNTASPSFVHVLTVPSHWSEASLTWNNAPQALENVSQGWVPVQEGCTSPCTPRHWDVSYAVSKAYAVGRVISFAVYSSDSAYDSGKFFTSSDTAGWEAVARPALSVVWGEP